MKKILFLFVAFSFLMGCKKDDDSQQLEIDLEIIRTYLADNNLTAASTSTGLHYIIKNEGFGTRPTSQNQVTVIYKGHLTNGRVFDESPNTGARFQLSGVIRGWTEGMQLFKEGGEGTLIIPSTLGYGSTATGTIPPNSVLIFDVKLVTVH
jgi:FKBP-type peptidyl-prolyl cis-trans isomerase FkpA